MRNDSKNTMQTVKVPSYTLPSKWKQADRKQTDVFASNVHNAVTSEELVDNHLGDSSLEKTTDSKDSVNNDLLEIYLGQAQAYWDEQQWEKALSACRNALQVSPHSAEAYKLLGNFYQQKGKSADAMGCYAKALALEPNFPEIYSNLGSLYAKQKKWKQAIVYYQKAISKDASFPLAYFNLAKVWAKLSNAEEERKCLLMALKLKPSMGTAQEHYKIALRFEEEGNKEEAIAFYRQSIQQSSSPNKITLTAYQRLADLLEDKGDWQAATHCYHKVLELTNAAQSKSLPSKKSLPGSRPAQMDTLPPLASSANIDQQVPLLSSLPKADQVLIYKLMKASSQKKLLQPASLSKSQLKRSQSQPVSTKTKAYLLNAQKATNAQDWPTAIGHFNQAIKQSPQSAVLYRNLAKALAYNRQDQLSAEVWFRAFLLEPDWPSANQYCELGKKLEELNKPKEAAYCYKQAVLLQPSHKVATVQLNLLTAGNAKPKGSDASQLNKKWLNGTKTNQLKDIAQANLAHQQGEALKNEGAWDKAVEAYQQAIKLNPSFSWSHHNVGICYRKLGAWDKAVGAYQKAIQLNPDFVWSHHNLGESLEELDRWEDAARAYRKAVKLQPDNTKSSERLIHVLQQCLKTQPRNTSLYAELAEQFILQNRVSDCISTYQTAMQIDPQSSELAERLSILLKPIDPVKSKLLLAQAESIKKFSVQVPNDLQNLDLTYQVLSQTNLFDAKYYSTQVTQSSEAYEDLLWHYLKEGSTQGIRPNPLFDTHYYLSTYTEVAELNINPLAHYHLFGYKKGYNPHPLFSTQYYQYQNSDVAAAAIDPLDHYLTNGAQLGREAFSPQKLLAYLSELTVSQDISFDSSCLIKKNDASPARRKTIGLYTNSEGNFFITQIAHLLETALQQAGHTVFSFTENTTLDETLDEHWVIAPHEFFYIGDGSAWLHQREWMEKLTFINVEQPQTGWFSKAFHFLRHAKAIIDISPQTAQMLREMQLPATWLPLGYLNQYKPLTATPTLPVNSITRGVKASIRENLPSLDSTILEREIDICFIGTLSQRREEFFAQNSSWLSQYQCFLHIPSTDTFTLSKENTLGTSSAVGLSRRSKILLNIHRDNVPYFEWHRIVFYGLWQQTLVLTEPCLDIPGLIPDEHFLTADLKDMEELVDWLLHTSEGKAKAEQVRKSGYQKFISHFSLSYSLKNWQETVALKRNVLTDY